MLLRHPAVQGLAICDVPHHLVHTVESQVHPNTAPRYFTYTPAVLRQSATQLTGREEADGALVAHGQGVTVTQGSNNLQERYLQVSKVSEWSLRATAFGGPLQGSMSLPCKHRRE